ncbi:hypothetical protein [Halorubrum lacusprofundi]|jgi:hypothetical protein|nr:hypothetical protein [Halorubrum lacusprofundi]
MNQSATRAVIGAGVILAALIVHLRLVSSTATLSAVVLVAVTSGVTAMVVSAHASERDAHLTEIRGTLARIREDQLRAKKQSEALVVDDPDD